jgi:nitrogen fixation protein FixH
MRPYERLRTSDAAVPAQAGQSHVGAALTSPRSRGEVGICALVAQIPGEGASPQALNGEFALAERPPHPNPLDSPSKTGVNALMASGEREHSGLSPDAIALPTPGAATLKRPVTARTVLLSLLGFFGVVIAVNAVMITLTVSTMPGLETEQPYQTGIGYNAEIEAARAQAARRWTVLGLIDRDAAGQTAVEIRMRDATQAPIGGLAVAVRLMRQTDGRADHAISLGEREKGIYVGAAAGVTPGVWDVEIEANRGEERLFRSKNRIMLK